MFQCKKINDLEEFRYPWYEKVWDFFWSNEHFDISYFFHRLNKNYLFWKNVLRYDYNFDAHGAMRMIAYKLECTHKCLVNEKWTEQDPIDMKALRIAIKLAKRLDKEEYDERNYRHAETKFGEHKIDWTDCEGKPGYSTMKSSWGGRSDNEYIQQVHEFKRAGYIVSEKCMERDERNLYAIMLKYRRRWWS